VDFSFKSAYLLIPVLQKIFFLSIIIYELKTHFYILSLIGSIISNNLFVIFLASLSGQGIFSLWKVWIIALIGILISDTIWFIIGKSATINKIARHRHFLYNYYSIKSILNKSEEKNNFFVFLGSKFIYGAKILTLIYAGKRKMRIKDFIKYNFTSSAIWISLLVFLGFLAGKGFARLMSYDDIHDLYGQLFTIETVDLHEHTRNNQTILNSEWVIVGSKK